MMDRFKKFMDQNLTMASPTYSLVYLYGLRFILDGAEVPTNEFIAETLHVMDSDVANAWNYWQRKGLVQISDGKVVFVTDKVKEKSAPKEIAKRMSEDSVLSWLYGEAEKLFGGGLSSADTRTLYWIYDNLNLPTEVILMLIGYARCNKKGMRYIEKTAIDWKEKEINTVEKADEYIKNMMSPKKDKKKITKFSNFEQRETSYQDIEDAYFEEILKGLNHSG